MSRQHVAKSWGAAASAGDRAVAKRRLQPPAADVGSTREQYPDTGRQGNRLSHPAGSGPQAELFERPAEEDAMSDGSPLTIWQKSVIAEWHQRHLNPHELTYGRLTVRCVPRGVYCARCRTPSVLFPAADVTADDNKGYCICPKCSQPKVSRLEVGTK